MVPDTVPEVTEPASTDDSPRSRSGCASIAGLTYVIAGLATFVYLTFFRHYPYTWWNWIFILPWNGFLSSIWPVYVAYRVVRRMLR